MFVSTDASVVIWLIDCNFFTHKNVISFLMQSVYSKKKILLDQFFVFEAIKRSFDVTDTQCIGHSQLQVYRL